jgi:D-3-phosphoglycerate dehydrogenase
MNQSNEFKILLADKLADGVDKQLESLGAIASNQPDLTADDLPAAIGDAKILIVRSTKVTAATINAATNLALIIRAGAGVNTIDVQSASDHGVQVANCPGTNAAAVAELAIGLLVSADRRIVDACQDLRHGKWRKKEYGKSHGLKGRTLGLLGFGSIGKAVARAAHGLDMNVIAWSRSLTPEKAAEQNVGYAASPGDLAKQSDAVSVHLAMNDQTRHMVNADFLGAMREGSILINTSRGELVDTAALKNAIANKKLRVGLDVFENEPAGGDTEFPDTEFAASINATPHIGASTLQTTEAIGAAVVKIVSDFVTNGRVSAINLGHADPASNQMVIRHYNRVGVLASVLDGLREENINIHEMENKIFDGGEAAICSLQINGQPSADLLKNLQGNESILNISVS